MRFVPTSALVSVFLAATASGQPWVFLSMPDFNNQDIGSIATLPTYDGGLDSTTVDYELSMDFIGQSLAAENPAFVAVAGDLVMGHWDRDVDGRAIFGPTNNLANKRSAVEAAAAHYYPIWLRRFTDYGITNVIPCIGDHELGDNNWSPGGDRARLVPDYKRVFVEELLTENGQHRFTMRPFGTPYEDTTYAFVHQNVLFVTVDEFRMDDPSTRLDDRTGAVLATVDNVQLAWLDSIFADARQPQSGAIQGVDFIVVQGHVPVLFPARERTTSRVYLRDFDGTTEASQADQGAATDFWQKLVEYDVDLYLCGEIHDVTLLDSDGVTQVVHGAITGQNSPINYLKVTVDGDRMDLEIKEISPDFAYNSALSGYGQNPLWQTGSNRPPSYYVIPQDQRDAGYQVRGTAVLDRSSGSSELIDPTGKLFPFDQLDFGPGLLMHYPLDGTLDNGGLSEGALLGRLEGDAAYTGDALIGSGALRVSGSGRAVLGDLSALGDSPRTVTMWVRTDGQQSGQRSIATLGSNVAGGKFDMDIDSNNGGVIELGVGSGRTTGAGPVVNDGEWHFLAFVIPSPGSTLADARMYVDGAFAYSDQNATRSIDTQNGAVILGHGANSNYFQSFTGDIDDFAIWNIALSDDMITALYELGTAPGGPVNAEASAEHLRELATGRRELTAASR